MNQTLNISRIGLLLKLHLTENGRSFLMAISLSVGVMLVLMSPILFTNGYNDLLFILHGTALFAVMLGSSLFSSSAFNTYNNASQGIPAIMLPASRLEKFLVVWLINLLFIGSMAVSFYFLHHWIIEAANQDIAEDRRQYNSIPTEVIRFFGFFYFILQSSCFLGSIYFSKQALLKTLGILTGTVIIAFVFNLILAYQFTGNPSRVTTFPFIFWEVIMDRRYVVTFPLSTQKQIYVFLSFLVVAIWGTTYVRLKEKEI
ncbi:hypothetical protein OKW21_000224 [Catalinimonas alkaloidigena]|uniref:hypothetical protein n=1 Tax=Catalinimonas alkaloidigena TaxID=1075417 RepID=UPI002404ADA8|nr:hypothetical protein [Catalinimonas alkaloidigena]MDF9794961.1 hypothetical protein [Catalinimonas alkaloidigena]